MFGTILGKYNQDESQEDVADNAMEEESPGFEAIYDFRSNIPELLKTEEVLRI
jgi:hypothetical protein